MWFYVLPPLDELTDELTEILSADVYLELSFYTEVDGINTQKSLDIFGWKLHIKSSLQTDLCYIR